MSCERRSRKEDRLWDYVAYEDRHGCDDDDYEDSNERLFIPLASKWLGVPPCIMTYILVKVKYLWFGYGLSLTPRLTTQRSGLQIINVRKIYQAESVVARSQKPIACTPQSK